MVASSGAKRALEIGGASGYSAIWIGLGLRETGGRLTTIEYDPRAREDAADEHPPRRPRRHRHRRARRRVQGDPEARRRRSTSCSSTRGSATTSASSTWCSRGSTPRGLFLAHNVVNKQNEMRDFLAAIQTASARCSRRSSRRRAKACRSSYKRCTMKPIHIIGVPLDLGGGRRGVDMGPSALPHRRPRRAASPRSATPSSTRATCRRRFPRRRSCATSTRSTSATSRRSARSSTRPSLASLDEGAMPLVLGGDHSLAAGSVAAAAEWAQARRSSCRSA